jgi:phosphate starvation-inducible PhoH-like protein
LRNGYRFARGDVKTAAQLLAQDPNVELQEYFQKGSSRTAGRRQVAPKSVTQRKYLEAIDKFDIVFGVGPAVPARRIWRWRRRCPICWPSA